MKENLKVEDFKKVLNDKTNKAVAELTEMIDSYKSAYHESKEKLEVMQEIETYTSNLEKLEGKVKAYIEIAQEFDIELDVEEVEEQEEEEDTIEKIVEPTTEPTQDKTEELTFEFNEPIDEPTQWYEKIDEEHAENGHSAVKPSLEDFATTTLIEPLPEVQESKEVIYALKTDSVAEEVVEPIHINPTIENNVAVAEQEEGLTKEEIIEIGKLSEASETSKGEEPLTAEQVVFEEDKKPIHLYHLDSDAVVDQLAQLTEEQIDEIREQVEVNANKLEEPITDVLVVAEQEQPKEKEQLEITIQKILSKNLHKYSKKYNTPFDTISFLIFYNEEKNAIEFNLYILKRFVTKLALPSDILDDDDNISTLDIITELRKKLDAYCVEFNCEKQDVKVQLATNSNTDDTIYLALIIRSSFVRWIDIAECVQQAMFSQKF